MRTVAIDEVRVKRGLLIGFLVLASVALAYFGLSRGMPAIGLAVPCILLVSQLFSRPLCIFILMLFLNTVKLKVPGLPDMLSLLVLSQVLMIVWTLLDVALRHQKSPFSFRLGTDIWLSFFLINIFILMMVRGTGFARLGGSVYGGALYVALILTILFYFSAVRIRLSEKNVKILIWIVFGGALLYAMLEVLVFYFQGAFGWISRFVLFAAGEKGAGDYAASEMTAVRWHSFRGLAFAMLALAYAWCRPKKAQFMIVAIAFLLAGLTGFRSIIVQMGLMIFMASTYYSKARGRTVFLWLLAGLGGLIFLAAAAPILPFTIQRAVSFIPFLNVDPEAALAAEQSSLWRFDMWRDYCIPNVSKYLLIGRGLSHDIMGFAWLSSRWYGTAEFFYYMGSYHNGPFDLLLTYGLAGTVSFTMFFLLTLIDGWRTVRRYASNQDSVAARYYVFLTLWLTYEVIAFYFIFGDVKSQLFLFLAIAVQLRVLKKNFLMESSLEAGVPEVGGQGTGVSGQETVGRNRVLGSGDSSATQQLTTNNRASVNRWARPLQRSRV